MVPKEKVNFNGNHSFIHEEIFRVWNLYMEQDLEIELIFLGVKVPQYIYLKFTENDCVNLWLKSAFTK